jgi:L-ascorbate metabolism protein UlaG (beta-lactamase superfamily)
MKMTITHIDTACMIIDINGFRIMTDPVLDDPGKLYHFGYGSMSRKLNKPAIMADKVGHIDMVLLSHHQHQDNFDDKGKEFTKSVPLVISTVNAGKKLSNAIGLQPWQAYEVNTDKVPGLKITATPGKHHPWWLPEFFSGTVTGFIIEHDHQPEGVVYITGDTVLFSGLNTLADKFKIDLAILHLGSVRFPYLTGLGKYTMNAADGVQLATQIGARRVMPIHTSGWTHFKESKEKARNTLENSTLADKVIWLKTGQGEEL